jgi:hypothetical protein
LPMGCSPHIRIGGTSSGAPGEEALLVYDAQVRWPAAAGIPTRGAAMQIRASSLRRSILPLSTEPRTLNVVFCSM